MSRGTPRGPLAASTARNARRRRAAVAVLTSDPPPSSDADRSIDKPPNEMCADRREGYPETLVARTCDQTVTVVHESDKGPTVR